jgi:hypothetical protein
MIPLRVLSACRRSVNDAIKGDPARDAAFVALPNSSHHHTHTVLHGSRSLDPHDMKSTSPDMK